MKKRIVTIALVVALIAILATSATMAFLTDSEAKTNVFTVGNVDVQILESKLHRDNDAATDAQIEADAATYDAYLAEVGKNMVPGRWVKKAPYIKNVGKNAAYVRMTVVQSGDIWDTTSMMEYTTAQETGAIVKVSQAQNANGDWVMVFAYTQPLEPGNVTYYAPFWQFKINDSMDNEDLVNMVDIENTIQVTVDAIQAEGFADYVEAFAAFDNQEN